MLGQKIILSTKILNQIHKKSAFIHSLNPKAFPYAIWASVTANGAESKGRDDLNKHRVASIP